jgi:chromate reductase, NAD(P)H dehydrogenase (quinone)
MFEIAVVVGSLRRESFNRKLATAIVKLAPPEFYFKQVQIGDLPLYNQDDDGNQAAAVKRLKSEIAASSGILFVTAVQPFNAGRPQECHRPCVPAFRPEQLGGETCRHRRRIARRGWNGSGAAAFAECSWLPRHADARSAGGFHSSQGRPVRCGGPHRRGHKGFLQSWMDRYVAWVKQNAPANRDA